MTEKQSALEEATTLEEPPALEEATTLEKTQETTTSDVIITGDCYILTCPHCHCQVQVPLNGVNCQIFRHGVYKNNPMRQIPPHAPKTLCDKLIADGSIIGCGRPFRFNGKNVAVCDYI